MPATVARFESDIENAAARRVFRVVVVKKPPLVPADRLKGITGRLARFSTRYAAGSLKRSHNISLATRAINGTVLEPGDVFSVNKTVGERTQARGYRTARVYENKKVVPGIGGGVSQVTGTLFNAALLAGLPILEYGTHAGPVSYLPFGRDATLGWNSLDMRFKNDTAAPLYIAYEASGGILTATIYGAKRSGRQIAVSVKAKRLGPHKVTAALYRTFKQDGKVVRKERIGRSDYEWKPNAQATNKKPAAAGKRSA